jgi:hypothetical protein
MQHGHTGSSPQAPRQASPFGPQHLYAFTVHRKHADHREPLTNDEIAAIPGLKRLMEARLPATGYQEASDLAAPFRKLVDLPADVELILNRHETE